MNDDKVYVSSILVNVKDAQIGSRKTITWTKIIIVKEARVGKGMHWKWDVILEAKKSN
jgi:hypothetical protein